MKNILLQDISKAHLKSLRSVPNDEKKYHIDCSLQPLTSHELGDEAEHWDAFFQSSCDQWFEHLKEVTFPSTFCYLLPSEARIIVEYWEEKRNLRSRQVAYNSVLEDEVTQLERVLSRLTSLQERLQSAIVSQTALSPVGRVFVKLSTRSPKDSKRALAKAKVAYEARVAEALLCGPVSSNTKWRILCEETTASTAVSSALEALTLLLDSERVYEDLEYALRGPSGIASKMAEESTNDKVSEEVGTDDESETVSKLQWRMKLVARAWDSRLKPQSEFRGIVWGGTLTCLCQYFHPLLFEELFPLKEQIQADIFEVFNGPHVTAAVRALGGNCIVDFAWLAKGEVIVIELNPFDGICLGVFPASTGLFLWEKPEDRLVMTGQAPFEFRLRENVLSDAQLKAQCNRDWREIIYPPQST